MSAGEEDILKDDVFKKDAYLKELNDIVKSRNKEISQKFRFESARSRGQNQEGANHRSEIEPENTLSIILLNLAKMKKYYDWSITQAIITFFIASLFIGSRSNDCVLIALCASRTSCLYPPVL